MSNRRRNTRSIRGFEEFYYCGVWETPTRKPAGTTAKETRHHGTTAAARSKARGSRPRQGEAHPRASRRIGRHGQREFQRLFASREIPIRYDVEDLEDDFAHPRPASRALVVVVSDTSSVLARAAIGQLDLLRSSPMSSEDLLLDLVHSMD